MNKYDILSKKLNARVNSFLSIFMFMFGSATLIASPFVIFKYHIYKGLFFMGWGLFGIFIAKLFWKDARRECKTIKFSDNPTE